MSRRFKRPAALDYAAGIDELSAAIESGYAMLNSIPMSCSEDRSIVGTMVSRYKQLRSSMAELSGTNLGSAPRGAPVIERATRIDPDSDTVASDGQRIANHRPSVPVESDVPYVTSGTSVDGSSISNKEIPTMAKQYRSGVVLNAVNSSAHDTAPVTEHRPLSGSVKLNGAESVEFKAAGYGWVVPNGSTRRSMDLGTLWVEAFHYDWTADEDALVLTSAVMSKLLGRSRVVNMLVNSKGVPVDEPKDAAFRVKFGKK